MWKDLIVNLEKTNHKNSEAVIIEEGNYILFSAIANDIYIVMIK